LWWRHRRRCERRLLEARALMAEEANATATGTSTTLRALDDMWAEDGRRKDERLRQLHLQNIEQKRARDRIVQALKSCRITVPPHLSYSGYASSAAGAQAVPVAVASTTDEVEGTAHAPTLPVAPVAVSDEPPHVDSVGTPPIAVTADVNGGGSSSGLDLLAAATDNAAAALATAAVAVEPIAAGSDVHTDSEVSKPPSA
jgi:hypothetical protein